MTKEQLLSLANMQMQRINEKIEKHNRVVKTFGSLGNFGTDAGHYAIRDEIKALRKTLMELSREWKR